VVWQEMINTVNGRDPDQQVLAQSLDHEAFKSMIPLTLAKGNPPELFTYWAGAKTQELVNRDRPLRVLIMDDEETVRLVLKAMLEFLGHQVFLTGNGNEALSLYEQRRRTLEPFDLVIVDLTIPGGMGGKKTMAELQKIDGQARAIVSSGYSNDPVMATYRQYGFAAAVVKPYVLSELTEAIDASFAGKV
jgi:two-component system, cell cycle sensor histidine kinase and response regulator CckA